jgi:hypothetical protein
MSKKDTKIEEYIACDCHCGGLLLVRFDEPEDEDFVYVSLWKNGYGTDCWRHRLRHIWHILRTGHAYTDQLVFDRASVKRLRHFCDVVLADGVFDRPWLRDVRAGEAEASHAD